jgi:hypothetical protein
LGGAPLGGAPLGDGTLDILGTKSLL